MSEEEEEEEAAGDETCEGVCGLFRNSLVSCDASGLGAMGRDAATAWCAWGVMGVGLCWWDE